MRQIHRTTGLVLLVAVSAFGIHLFLSGNPGSVLDFWAGKGMSLALLFAFAVIDIILDFICWLWVYRIFRIRIHNFFGVGVFVSGYAGALLPMRLGNLVRPDVIERRGIGTLNESMKAEISILFFDGVTAVSIITGIVAYWLNPITGLPAAVFVIGCSLLFLRFVTKKIPAVNKLNLPRELWNWKNYFFISLIGIASWSFNALALYVVLYGLPGNAGIDEAMFISPLSSLFVTSTGIPGGIGAMEAFLGFSLSIMGIPSSQLVIAIGAFRLVTFWIWIPVGWAALISTNRFIQKKRLNSCNSSKP